VLGMTWLTNLVREVEPVEPVAVEREVASAA
jgi:hypothetical protein